MIGHFPVGDFQTKKFSISVFCSEICFLKYSCLCKKYNEELSKMNFSRKQIFIIKTVFKIFLFACKSRAGFVKICKSH